MNTCSNCNTISPEGAKFCLECGRPLALGTEAPRLCSSCGQTLARAVNYCTFCGARQGGTQDEIEFPATSLSARLEIKTPPSERGYETRVDTGKLVSDPSRVTKRMEQPAGTAEASEKDSESTDSAAGYRTIPDTDPLPVSPPALPPTQRIELPPPEASAGANKKNALILLAVIALIIITAASVAGYLLYKRSLRPPAIPEESAAQPLPQQIPEGNQAEPASTPGGAPAAPAPALTPPPAPSSPGQEPKGPEAQKPAAEPPAQKPVPSGPTPEEIRRAEEQKAAEAARAEEARKAQEEQRRLQALRDAEDRRQRELAATPRTGNFHWKALVDGTDDLVIHRENLTVRHLEAQEIKQSAYSFSSPLPPFMTKVELTSKRGRGKARIVQAPGPSNDFTLIVRVEDPKGGAEWLEFTVRWEVVER